MSLITRYRSMANKHIDHLEQHPRWRLSAGQHILHLMLTVLTAGLWLPVWLYRALRGNPAPGPGGPR